MPNVCGNEKLMPPITSHEIDLHIGRRIRVRRKLLGIDEKALAEAAGISLYRLRRYESAHSTILAPSLSAIAKELGVPFSYFFDRPDDIYF